eukprot:CAMPEP_0198143406 /NCGR_PEP_ID=MMETSP1443-20131203/7265_1 /TAXON_ID=186043 /ORGANISM="Entomoneis sp., Strain CCMP2396" /LENGTH=632 /DNA_ID=CAMNT_0043806639 /DNA_START=103 /DNA_END=1998 /DNA_ORIENTATION=+
MDAEQMIGNDQDEVPTASVGKWIFLIVVAAVSFWSQAAVTEERFVPALNVIANIFNIPDDIAGATLMAAGASSPELFSSFVSLFITHSSLGLGTVFGSEVFNQLIIIAGAVYSSKSGHLKLDRAIVSREVFFYALGIVALYFALQDVEPVENDDSGIDHIFISFLDSCMVFVGYFFYVIVCANMDYVVACFTGLLGAAKTDSSENALTDSGNGSDRRLTYGTIKAASIDVDANAPFLTETSNLMKEPSENFEYAEYHRTTSGEAVPSMNKSADQSSLENGIQHIAGKFSDGKSLRAFQFLVHNEKPSDDRGLYDTEINSYEQTLSCFMWQRSYFYNKARFATNGWHLRWFCLTDSKMYSVPDRANFERHKIKYPAFTEINVDRERHIIKMVNPNPKNRDFYFMLPSEEIMDLVIKKMSEIMEVHIATDPTLLITSPEETMGDHDDNVESLIEFPSGKSNLEIFFFLVLFPVRALMHFTVPDVRTLDSEGNPNSTLAKAALATVSCLAWLIVGSYAMVASLEALAGLLDIPDAVIGYTVSAAGTSLPNYVASAIAARNGLGNMAVSNALGSNTFNIMIGLGLPWVLYTSFGTQFQPYNELRDEGITEGVFILAAILLLLVLLLLQSGFVLYKW